MNELRQPATSQLRVYLAHLPTVDLLAWIRHYELLGHEEETEAQFRVRSTAVDVLCGRHPSVDGAVQLWLSIWCPDYSIADAIHRGLEGLPGVWPCVCCSPTT